MSRCFDLSIKRPARRIRGRWRAITIGEIAWFPVVVAVQALFTTALALILAALTVHFRDIKDLLATVGVGLTGQYVEQFGRKLVGGLLGSIGGGLLRGIGSAGTGAAFSFATTYALGQVAKRYYAGGRTLDGAGLQQAFQSMLGDARQLQGKYTAQIAEQARTLDLNKLLAAVKG